MAAFTKWVKNYFDNLVDPEKNDEVTELTLLLQTGINERKRGFVLSDVLGGRPHKSNHLDQARNGIYQRYLNRAWADGRVQVSEREILNWVATCLEIPQSTVRAINLERARPIFAQSLAKAMDDGEITQDEADTLDAVAKAGGMPLQQFVREFFLSEGEQFLRGLFAAAVTENQSALDVLEKLVVTASKLGLSRDIVLKAIQPQAVRYIEHALADAKEDDILTAQENSTLRQLLKTFDVLNDVARYITSEIDELGVITNIRGGKLPTLTVTSGVNTKSGELVHYHGPFIWRCLKLLQRGPIVVQHEGFLTITDSRIMFNSPTCSESFPYASIVSYDSSRGIIEVQRKAKPEQKFIPLDGRRIPAAIFQCAIRMANQLLVNQDEKRRSRHIPRETRQRVWQRYGGRCAECDAGEYLEFDHIVPVAKGGSNSDVNVQLLCRKCNSKKSDTI